MINESIKADLRQIFAPNKILQHSISYYYKQIADKYGVHPERVRKHHRMLKDKEQREGGFKYVRPIGIGESYKKTNNETGVIESTVETTFDPKSDIELAELHKIDLNKYKISSYWSKLRPNGKFSSSVFAALIKVDHDLGSQKQIILDEIKSYIPSHLNLVPKSRLRNLNAIPSLSNCLLEVALPDMHFGKLSHGEESGQDYDLKIAGERFHSAIDELVRNAPLDSVERILFPIGNDMFNVDNMNSTTTGGTPQDTDTRFHKMVKYVKNILIEEIDRLAAYAPVDVVVVPGNHDEQTAFMLGEILDAFYHNSEAVTIDNGPKLRKYYKYGNSSILLTHGDKEKHSNLGMIFAAEEPQIWADTKYRFVQLGHYHHNKKISYLANDEFQGFQIQILPSLSPNDKWHYGKGFNSLKQAKGFLYNKEKGLVAEYTYTV